MKLINVVTALWGEPWLITPAMHKKLCDIVDGHITGAAHAPGGIAVMFPGDDKPAEYKFQQVDNLAVIPIHGVIGKHVGAMEKSSGATDVNDIDRELDRALDDDSIKGILLDINSPGGTTTGVPELADKIAQVAVEMPVVAYTDSMMASAAYWLGSSADLIVASQSAQVGSIGVYMAWLDESRAMEMQGYKMELIKRGKFKGAGISGTSLSQEGRDLLQKSVDQVYDWFTDHVKTFREDAPQEAMEGQTFFSVEALQNDLIDMVGTRNHAMRQLSEMAQENTGGEL